MAKAAEREDRKRHCDLDPPVPADDAMCWNAQNAVRPAGSMHGAEVVSVPLELRVLVQDVRRRRQKDACEHNGEAHQANEAGLVGLGGCSDDGGESKAVLNEAVADEDGVAGVEGAHSDGEHEDEDDGEPGLIVRGHAPGDRENIVAARLHDVVRYHYPDGQEEHEEDITGEAAHALSASRDRVVLVGVED